MALTFSGFRSLKFRILAVVLTVFLVSVAVLAVDASRSLRFNMEKMLGDQQAATVALTTAEINANFKERSDALTLLAGEINESLIDQPQALQKRLENRPLLVLLFNAGVFVVRRDGVAIAEVPKIGRAGLNYLDRDHVAAALQEGRATVGKPIVGKRVKAPSFAITVPIRDAQGGVVGALVGATDLSKPNFLDSLIASSYGKTGGYLIVDPKNRVFVTATANNKKLVMQALPAPGVNTVLDQRILGFDGTAVNVSSQGIQVLTSSSRIPIAGWFVISTLPTEEAFEPILRVERRLLISAAVLTLLSLSLTFWLLQRLLSPMQNAATYARNLALSGGSNNPLPIVRQDEIGDLIDGVNRVLAVANEREKALSNSEYRLRVIVESMAEGLVTQDSGGNIVYANPSAERILGLSLDQMKGATSSDPMWGSVHEDGSPYLGTDHPAMLALRIGAAIHDQVMGIDRPETGRRWISINSVPLFLETSSVPDSVITTFIDITERKTAEDALKSSESQFRSFFDKNLAVMLTIRPLDGQILRANRAATEFYGYDQAELQSKHIYDLNILTPEECYREMADATYERRNFFKFRHRIANGSIRDVEVYSTPIQFLDVITLFTIVHDVTERNQIAAALSESEARYARVVDGTDEGYWEWDLVTKAVIVSTRFESMLGYGPGEWNRSYENWRHHVHPDDVERSMHLFQMHLQGEIPQYAAAFRMRTKLGEWIWIQSKGKVASRDGEGHPILIAGTHTDITRQRVAEDALKTMNNDFVKVLESSSDFMYFKDQNSRIRYCSQTMANITGHTSWREMVGKHDLEIFPPETAEIYHQEEAPIFAEGIPLLNKIDPYIKPDGSRGWVSTNKWPLFADDGRTVVGLFGISRDVTEAKRHEDELRVMATTDFLTGAESRRTFLGAVDYEIARIQRDSSCLCAVMMFDLDHFKHVNDTYGHATGDEVLKHITKLISNEIRKVDRIGRLGGEEFAVLMPGADITSAKIFAERLRQKVETSPICVNGKSIVVTVSIGLSSLRGTDGSTVPALERVDKALYMAKNGGRNRVEVLQ